MKVIRKKAKSALQKFVKELNEYSEIYAKMHTRDYTERR
jgi:hypothetical protein